MSVEADRMQSLLDALAETVPFLEVPYSTLFEQDDFIATAEKVRARVRAAADAPPGTTEDELFERVAGYLAWDSSFPLKLSAAAALVRHYANIARKRAGET